MTVAAFAFYLFAIVAVVSAMCVVTARNPVHSVLWLILTFLSAAGLFVLMGAEFVAMLLIIVYVGAVAVLFLFVVMMLDIDFSELKAEMTKYTPFGVLICLVVGAEFIAVVSVWHSSTGAEGLRQAVTPDNIQNTKALGELLYDKYVLLFMLSAMVLLVAMIGAIVLTMRHRKTVKRQNVLAQMWRDPAKAMELKDVKPGQGL